MSSSQTKSTSMYSQPYAIAVLIRATLYGFYFATFVHYCWWLSADSGYKSLQGVDRRLLSFTVFIFVFLTMSVGVTFKIFLDLLQDDKASAVLSIVKTGIENTMVLITNAFLIYRCWVVFTKSHPWIIILIPLFLWTSSLTCSVLICFWYAHDYLSLLSPGVALLFSRQIPASFPYWVVFYVFDITINIYVTYGIIHRIRTVINNTGSRKLYTICKILAQFSCLYIFTTLLSLISVIVDRNNNGYAVILDTMRFALDSINLMVPGITFNIAQILVHRERARVASAHFERRSQLERRSNVLTTSPPTDHYDKSVDVQFELGERSNVQTASPLAHPYDKFVNIQSV